MPKKTKTTKRTTKAKQPAQALPFPPLRPAPEGYSTLIIGWGAVRLNIPKAWVVVPPQQGRVMIYDQAPPAENCRLSVSYTQLPRLDWGLLTLENLLETTLDDDTRETTARSEIVRPERTDVDLVWADVRFLDPDENREAVSRQLLVRARMLQAFINFDLWASDLAQYQAEWEEVVQSVELGRYVEQRPK